MILMKFIKELKMFIFLERSLFMKRGEANLLPTKILKLQRDNKFNNNVINKPFKVKNENRYEFLCINLQEKYLKI